MSVPLTYVVFDALRRDGDDLITKPYSERRTALPGLATCETFDDGPALFDAVCRSAWRVWRQEAGERCYGTNERGSR